ncbi:ATP-binding protein [Rhodonellum sp.]|uniref:DNA polymerase III subunit n=1 Tax=Rhodonellum sp. TaxID=2231180 RepID=UPI002727BC3E|nr:hypothetical protein [Rhodonellum sp.]MDO9551324.1 hypothetical protein [Rhodonellum sp.]
MLFSSIPGLEETKEKIIQAVKDNHLAHALLFHGQEGSPNLKMALALSTYLHCAQPGENDACGICPACQKMAKLIHPDMNFVFPMPGEGKESGEEDKEKEKKTDFVGSFRKFALESPYGNVSDWIHHNDIEKKQLNISKGAARQIIKTISLKSFEGGYKIMLIWAPEYLHPSAANSLLKVLEEPPQKTLFLLVTTQPEQLLTTILSRTQKIMVRGFSDDEVRDHLLTEGLCSKEGADQVTQLADGNMREAYRLVDEVRDENTSFVRDWFRLCFSLKINEIFKHAEIFSASDKESQKAYLLSGLNVIREVLLKKAQLDSLMRSASEDRDFIEKLGVNVLDEIKMSKIYEVLNEAHYHLERNANAKILFAELSFRLYNIMKIKSGS